MVTNVAHNQQFAAILSILALHGTVSCSEAITGSDEPQADPSAVVTVNVLPVTATVSVGFTRQFSTDLRDANGNAVATTAIAWEVNDPSIATVSSTGEIAGVAPGIATLAATVNGVTGTARVTVIPQQTAQGDTVVLSIRRLDGGTGNVLVSSGIPLPPGYLREGQTGQLSVVVDGQEQSIYIEPLVSRHPDGSIRSVLVQFNTAVSAASPLGGFAIIGAGVSRNAPDIAKTAVAWSRPAAVALPTSAEYLASTLIVGPTATVDQLPAGFFQQWQSDFTTVGQTRWDSDPRTDMTYHQYDRTLVWFAGWARTGDAMYWDRGNQSAIEYITLQETGDYSYPPRMAEVPGSEVHYLLTGDPRGRNAVQGIAEFMDIAAFRIALDRDPFKDWMDSRIQSYVLMSSITAARLEIPGKDWTAQARQDLNDIFSTQGTDGAIRWFSWDDGHSVFMASLLVHAVIKYYTWLEPDPRIPPFVKRILDFVHPTLWVGDSWQYTSIDTTSTPDLNQLNGVGYAWYGWLSGDQTYTDIARTAFQWGSTDAFLGYKQFNQNYRGAFQTAYYILNP